MLRTCKIALFSATLMVFACKKADPPAAAKVEDTAKPTDPAKPADPAAKPADPAAKPADPAAKPAAVSSSNSELETKGIAMMQRMGDIFAANAKDCEKLAAEIKRFAAENKPLLGQLLALEKSQSEAQNQAFADRNKQAQADVMAKMQPAGEACDGNKSFQAAMKDFPAD